MQPSDIVIWDSDECLPSSDLMVVLWRAFSDGARSNVVSIPQLIEESADGLRSRYLAWVYELGEIRINDCSLIDHLQMRSGFSYWWMTLLVEKCNYEKSPQIDDAIRFFAFTDWVADNKLNQLTLITANQPLAECLRMWCQKMGVSFKWQRLPKPVVQLSWLRRAYVALPLVMQSWVWLVKYLLNHWSLRGVGLQAWRQTTGSITFVSYLFNLVPEAANVGRYESRYWGPLPEVLQGKGYTINWLHLYVKDELLPRANKAADLIQTFNTAGRGMEIHATLDTFLSLRVMYQALADSLLLAWKGKRLKRFIAKTASQSRLDLWPLFAEDWRESTYGATAMSNVLHRSLFEAAMKVLPKQQLGCYLQENQGWEFALIQHWKRSNQGCLIGVPHSMVRFWDLRYFFDSRSYGQKENNQMPLPDLVAVNGDVGKETYLTGGYPSNSLVEVEALRYLHLDYANVRPVSESRGTGKGWRLLVLGDYLARNTRLQMRLLAQGAAHLPPGTVIIVKPHPACPIHPEDYPELCLTVVREPLADLFAECDIAYTSAVTSAAVDAYCVGIPVVSVLDPTMLNLSPLRGWANSFYVVTPEDLIRAFNAATRLGRNNLAGFDPFILDRELPRWCKLFDNLIERET